MNQEKPRLIDANALEAKLDEVSSLMARRAEKDDPGFLAVGAGITLAQSELDAAPAIDPVRHAHWILHPEIAVGGPDKECSACGAMSLIWSHYCHACGAKMDEEENT